MDSDEALARKLQEEEYKRIPCRDYNGKGGCPRGAQCRYGHSGQPQLKEKSCKNFRHGLCRMGQNCPFAHLPGEGFIPQSTAESQLLHPLAEYKRIPCRDFNGKGGCPRGAQCKYGHNDPSPREHGESPALQQGPERTSRSARTVVGKPCKEFFIGGACNLGTRCPFLHELPAERSAAVSTQPSHLLPDHRNIPCRDFNGKGGCPRGAQCKYGHNEPSSQHGKATDHGDTEHAIAGSARSVARKACNFFRRGMCRKGPTCQFAHNSSEVEFAHPMQRQRSNSSPDGHRGSYPDIDVDHMGYEDLLELEDRMGRVIVGVPPEVMSRLPVTIVRVEPASNSVTCAVCVDKMDIGERVRILPCQHAFHVECVDPWLAQHVECPVCRVDLREATSSVGDCFARLTS